jgi:L-rhamnose mutarotase
MSASNRVMFRFQVRPELLDEYREAHAAVWPDMLRALKGAGWNNYSIFTAPDGLVVGYAEVDDLGATQARMDAAEVNTRWQEAMGRFFVDSGPDEAMDRLDEAFHQETQLANADTNQKEK